MFSERIVDECPATILSSTLLVRVDFDFSNYCCTTTGGPPHRTLDHHAPCSFCVASSVVQHLFTRLTGHADGAVVTYTYITYDRAATGETTTTKVDGSCVRLGTITRKLATENAFTILEASRVMHDSTTHSNPTQALA